MQPVEGVKKSKDTARREIKRLIAGKLFWLHGYPTGQCSPAGIDWICADLGMEKLAVSRERLSSAVYTVRKLRADFPVALPLVVGDGELWAARNLRLLALLTSAVHEQRPLTVSLFADSLFYPAKIKAVSEEIQQSLPLCTPLLLPLSWLLVRQPQKALAQLHWLKDNPAPFLTLLAEAVIDLPLAARVHYCLQLLVLREIGENLLVPLCRRLQDRRIYEIPLGGEQPVNTYISGLKEVGMRQGAGKKAEPEALYWLQLLQWLEGLAGRTGNKKKRRKIRICLELFALIEQDLSIGEWTVWWCRLRGIAARLNSVAGAQPVSQLVLKTLVRELKAHRKIMPLCFHGQQFLETVSQLAERCTRPQLRYLEKALQLLPRDHTTVPCRIHFLYDIEVQTRSRNSRKEQAASWDFIRALPAYLTENPRPLTESLALWKESRQCWQMSRTWGSDMGCDISYAELNLQQNRRLLVLIRTIQEQGIPLQPNYVDTLIELLLLSREDDEVISFYREFVSKGIIEQYLADGLLKTAYILCVQHPGSFAKLVAILMREEDYEDSHFKQLQFIHTLAKDSGFPELIVLHLLRGGLKRVLRVSRQLLKIKNQVLPLPQMGEFVVQSGSRESQQWIDQYPAAIRQQLRLLQQVSSKTRKIAGKVLHKDFPQPEQLKKELVQLSRKIKQYSKEVPAALLKRAATIRCRLEQPSPVSPVRQQRLEEKLQWAYQRLVFDSFADRVHQQWLAVLPALGSNPAVSLPWLQNKGITRMFLGIDGLTGRQQALALTILEKRCQSPPWDFRDYPANEVFIQRMKARSISMDCWLNGFSQKIQPPGRGKVILALENDPLEVFQMGGHFKTCLSPGAFNFFSVLANISDINKRVVYARSRGGMVVGRCLLALTDGGGIVSFHPYCHDEKLGFSERIKEYVAALAQQMGTIAVSEGYVATLVASSWYDDGSENIGNSFTFLKKGSRFRKNLQTMSPEKLIPVLVQEFTPLLLNELTLGLVAELPEVLNRQGLCLALLEYFKTHPKIHCPSDVICRLATGGADKETIQEISQQFGREIIRSILTQYRKEYILNEVGMDFLVQSNPSKAIAVLHKLRPVGVRHWQETENGRMIFYQAEAFAALARPQRALALYRRALDVRLPGKLSKRAELAMTMIGS